jgi:hypothetical protein
MGTQLYDKTEKPRFTTPTRSNGKNNVHKEFLQTLFTPDDTGTYFRRKSDKKSNDRQIAQCQRDDLGRSTYELQDRTRHDIKLFFGY